MRSHQLASHVTGTSLWPLWLSANVPRLDSNTGGGRYTPSEPSQHVCIKYFKCSLYTCINKNNNSFSYKKACASSVRKLNYERVTKKVKLKVWNIWNIPTKRQGWGWRWEEGDEEGVRARGHFMHPTKIKIERDESMKLEKLRENSALFFTVSRAINLCEPEMRKRATTYKNSPG